MMRLREEDRLDGDGNIKIMAKQTMMFVVQDMNIIGASLSLPVLR